VQKDDEGCTLRRSRWQADPCTQPQIARRIVDLAHTARRRRHAMRLRRRAAHHEPRPEGGTIGCVVARPDPQAGWRSRLRPCRRAGRQPKSREQGAA
jgi:hypothetical protein